MRTHFIATILCGVLYANSTRAALNCEEKLNSTDCLSHHGGVDDGANICGWCNNNNKCVKVPYEEEEYEIKMYSPGNPDGSKAKGLYPVYPLKVKFENEQDACTLQHLSILHATNPNHAEKKKDEAQEGKAKVTWPEDKQVLDGIIKCLLRGPTNLPPKEKADYELAKAPERTEYKNSLTERTAVYKGQKVTYTEDEQRNCSTCGLYAECSFYEEGITQSTVKDSHTSYKAGGKEYSTKSEETEVVKKKNACVRNGGLLDAKLKPEWADFVKTMEWSVESHPSAKDFLSTVERKEAFEADEEITKTGKYCTWWDTEGYYWLGAAAGVCCLLIILGGAAAVVVLVVLPKRKTTTTKVQVIDSGKVEVVVEKPAEEEAAPPAKPKPAFEKGLTLPPSPKAA